MGRTERLAQPKEFGNYQLVARLAKGRMADVYKAKRHGVEGFEKVMCVKLIHPHLAAHPQFVETVIDEVKRCVALSHANIAQVINLGHEEDQHYYIVIEYVGGLDLARAQRLAKKFGYPWSMELSLFVASEIAKALDYAHRRKDFNFQNLNILHRSLRPPNVMLSYDGEVKLTDFGTARAMELTEALDDEEALRRLRYAAPETLRGQPYTRQSDIFSLGLVLYEMLAGTHPYSAESIDEVRRLATEANIAPITNFADVPRPLQQILESMLVADPAGRAQSAGQLYEELIGFIFGNSLQADNRMLAMAMQELRSRDQNSSAPALIPEAGLEEISQHELDAFGGNDAVPTQEAQRPALPSSQLGPRSSAAQGGERTLPGALEKLYQSATQGGGKAVLLSGRMGRGRQVIFDRLVEVVESRHNSRAVLLTTSDDDQFRPFGIFSDLILQSVHHTVAQTLDHRKQALSTLAGWGVSEEARRTMGTLWELDGADTGDQATRRQHLIEVLWAILRHSCPGGTFVLVIDRVERLDQASLDTLRDVIAAIGDLPVLLVLGTQNDDAMRAIFDAGQPRDLEAIRVGGEEPPTPEELQELSASADTLLTLLSLADRMLTDVDAAVLLEWDADSVKATAEELLKLGAIRSPRAGRLRADVSNWLTWRRTQRRDGLEQRLAVALARHYVHRTSRGETGRLSPTLLRLYAIAGERRQLLSLAATFGDWLQKNAWQHTALKYYRHVADLLGHYGLGVPHVRVDFVLKAAELALEMARIDQCRTLLEPLSALTETTRNEAGFVQAQLLLGKLAMQQDDLDEARAHFQRSVQTARGLQVPELLASATLALAVWYERFGDPAAALERLESAINLYTRFGTRRMELKARADLLQQSARLWASRGMLQRAERSVRDLELLAQAVPYPSIRCRAAIAAGRQAAFQGDLDRAGHLYDVGLGLARSHGLSALGIELLRERAGLCVRFERFENATTWADQVIGFAESRGDYYSEQRARDLRALACCHLQREVDQSLDQLRTSLRRATERGVPKDVFRGHTFMARALEAVGRADEAFHHRQHAEQLGRTMRMSWAA